LRFTINGTRLPDAVQNFSRAFTIRRLLVEITWFSFGFGAAVVAWALCRIWQRNKNTKESTPSA